jgi:hypothetical protein
MEGGKPKNPQKNIRSKGENQKQLSAPQCIIFYILAINLMNFDITSNKILSFKAK